MRNDTPWSVRIKLWQRCLPPEFMQGEGSYLEIEVERRIVEKSCKHCLYPPKFHADDKCIFQPTTYEATGSWPVDGESRHDT